MKLSLSLDYYKMIYLKKQEKIYLCHSSTRGYTRETITLQDSMPYFCVNKIVINLRQLFGIIRNNQELS